MTINALTFSLLLEANRMRNEAWDPTKQLSLSFRGLELGGEAGEAQNIIKKLERERLGIRGSRANIGNLAEELADVIICCSLIAMDTKIDLELAVIGKFNATSEARGLPIRLAYQNNQVVILEGDTQ